MPINQPLYGLTLFGIIPSLCCLESTFIRPAVVSREVVEQIVNILGITELFPNVEILNITRNKFLKEYVFISDVVIFVGKYDNAIKAKSFCKTNSLFLFSGAGVNPFIINKDANMFVLMVKQ